MVFVVGGGNYMEYSNLVSYAKKKAGTSNKRIIYGCTDVINSEQFLSQVRDTITYFIFHLQTERGLAQWKV